MPGPEELLAIRTWIAENHAAFRKAARGPEKLMGKLHGDSLTRAPKGFDPAHPASDLIRMKSWLYWIELEAELAESPKLLAEVLKRFRAAAPVVEMLNAPLVSNKRAPSKAGVMTKAARAMRMAGARVTRGSRSGVRWLCRGRPVALRAV